MLGASRGAFQSILKTNFLIQKKEKSSETKVQASAKQAESNEAAAAINSVKKLNTRNWLYTLRWLELYKDEPKEVKIHPSVALPDFECIRIRILHLKLADYLFAPKQTVLEALGLRVNLYSMVTENR